MRLSILIFLVCAAISAKAQDKEPTNKHFWYSLETTASPETIWSIWTDVPNWKEWDAGLKDANLEGEFALKAKGKITSLEGRKSKFKVIEYVEGQSYTYKTSLPLGGLYVKRYLNTQNGKTTFTHEVWFQGLTGGLFAKAFGENFRNMLPDVLGKIKEIAEPK